MKKQKLILSTLILITIFISCSNNDEGTNNCSDLESATEIAADNYGSNNSQETCNLYKDALDSQISSCGDESGSLQSILEGLGDCSEIIPQGVISVTVGTLMKTFEENITIEQNGSTLTIRAEDDLTNDWISFELEDSATGTDIISNFKAFLISKEYTPTSNVTGTFTSTVTTNSNTTIEGLFSGPVVSSDNAVLSLTAGNINLNY